MAISKNSNLLPLICGIYYALPEEVVSLSYSSTDLYHKTIVFKTGKAWKQIYFTPGSAEFTENDKSSDPGILSEQTLKFIFPGEDENNNKDIDLIKDRPVLVKIFYPSINLSKIMGTLENGARLISNLTTSPKSSGREMIFACLGDEPASWLT